MAAPNLADKSWVTNQYDRYVQGNTVLSQPEDSGVIRIDTTTNLGVAISTDANARWSYLNPYEGAKLALLESCRNIATNGAKPLAVTNCLNFGSPEDPEVMWQFSETVRGLADACLELGLPVTGGNVSFYNQTGSVAILPTPVIGVLGVVQDVTKRTPMGIKADQVIYVIGNVDENFSGSEWAYIHGKQIGDHSPVADLDMEKRLVNLLLEGQQIFEAAHDISNGGFAASISEMVLRTNVGATITLEVNVAAELLAETPGRVVVSINEKSTNEIVALAGKYQIPVRRVGTTGGNSLTINGGAISIDELRAANTGVLEALFG
jgi:phosphoribosylformylglycinamidine synthase